MHIGLCATSEELGAIRWSNGWQSLRSNYQPLPIYLLQVTPAKPAVGLSSSGGKEQY